MIMGDSGPFETVADERWHTARIRVLGEIGSTDISRAVGAAPGLLDIVGLDALSYIDRNQLGQALVLGGRHGEGWTALANAAEEITPGNRGHGQWLWWQAAWAAWWASDRRHLKQATDSVLTDAWGRPLPRDMWGYSQWLAAWFLDRVSEAEFVAFCSADPMKADDAQFFIGEKLLRAGKHVEARAAYELSVELGAQSGDAWAANWARWRLGQLEQAE
ncbi:MAG: hypothetical protein JW889_03075 [Verrucomicrobia bacterium]|nr:hypothetical protein [Verrucomicrobiota bacterium]